jgi:plastocyanin
VKRSAAILLALAGLLLLAAPASAAPQTKSFRYGPITVDPYQVKQDIDLGGKVPTPNVDGFITAMDVDIVDADGTKVPIRRLMLHHIVFANLGRRDGTCGEFTALDSRTKLPGYAERFYGAGEERARLQLPEGYGYPIRKGENWVLTWMLMNHRAKRDTAYIEYHITYDTDPSLKPAKPYWLDVKNCLADPVFDAPGGRGRGSTYKRTDTWTVPETGRIIAGGGHVHGGGKRLDLTQVDCSNRRLITSEPTWGLASHPFYNVRPILHEPGPINMSGTLSKEGFAVTQGQRLKLTATYDNARPHTRVMGIMLVYLAPDASAEQGCAPLPDDVRTYGTNERGRRNSPAFRVPIVGIGDDGVARDISKPPGRRKKLASGSTIGVHDFYFGNPNVTIRQGGLLRWRFSGSQLHNVTLANGPRGFSSKHLDAGRVFRKRFRVPGTYRLFCGLHPVKMTETVKVKRRRR